jgi:hypothetical protein
LGKKAFSNDVFLRFRRINGEITIYETTRRR